MESIEAQCLEVLGEFGAPSGLRGYNGVAGQQPVVVYATADGKHGVVGTLINAHGIADSWIRRADARIPARPLSAGSGGGLGTWSVPLGVINACLAT